MEPVRAVDLLAQAVRQGDGSGREAPPVRMPVKVLSRLARFRRNGRMIRPRRGKMPASCGVHPLWQPHLDRWQSPNCPSPHRQEKHYPNLIQTMMTQPPVSARAFGSWTPFGRSARMSCFVVLGQVAKAPP